MAKRTYYIPSRNGILSLMSPEFKWFGGFAKSQGRKCVQSLHDTLHAINPAWRILDTTTRSTSELGVRLSARNMTIKVNERDCDLEAVYQASKVYEGNIGPHPEMYTRPGGEVKSELKAKTIGLKIVGYNFNGVTYPAEPKHDFYYNLVLRSFAEHPDLGNAVMDYDCFTDITFNPDKGINCQAAAIANYVYLRRSGKARSQ